MEFVPKGPLTNASNTTVNETSTINITQQSIHVKPNA